VQLVKYKPARLGLGTESSQTLQPIEFAPEVNNRFYNLIGDLEKRPGLEQLGTAITTAFVLPVSANITNIHEYIDTSGNSTLFASGSTNSGSAEHGVLWRYNEVSAYWENVFVNAGLAKAPGKPMYSVQMNDKLIFCNGTDRNFFIDNPSVGVSAGYTKQLFSTVIKGVTGSGTNNTTVFDNNVSDWINDTEIRVNDLMRITQGATSDRDWETSCLV